ncbi:MAG: hypothetical protein DI586_01455 [Micavibrio aeruginosavorus]|uniref:Bleomycin resistance protein n=1 Tax=Micavibrio aeruginosavorus TaxID=349221 RepID=A0A2W5HU07_9BACT|nr:MAG: hypothetical protein DI586_01455 [Micavibrio aeruginosavorus]
MKLHSLIPELCISNYEASRKFYVDILGFKILYDRVEENFAMLEYQGSQLMIDQMPEGGSRWQTAEMQKPFGRGINIQIDTDNVDALYERIKNSGHSIFHEIEEKWYRAENLHLGNRQFLVQDPDGYLLRFAQDLGERNIQTR